MKSEEEIFYEFQNARSNLQNATKIFMEKVMESDRDLREEFGEAMIKNFGNGWEEEWL